MNFRNSLNHFFQGRYGIDSLNRFLLVLLLFFTVLYLLIGAFWIDTLCLVIAALMLFRMLSRNYANRSAENRKFLEITAPVREKINQLRSSVFDAGNSSYKIFVCPTCRQKLRVPKGKGRIRITCPKCRGEFEKRS